MEREADFSGILSETFSLVSASAKAIALYVAVVGGLNAVGFAMGIVEQSELFNGLDVGFMVNAEQGLLVALFQIVIAVVTLVGSYLVLRDLLAKRGRLHDKRMRFWGYLGMSILALLGLMLGLILLIVPGLIVLVRWSAANGFLLGEGEGITDALGKSWEATRGHGWAIFFVGVVITIGLSIVGGAIAAAALSTNFDIAIFAVSAFVDAFSNALLLALSIAVFHLVAPMDTSVSEVFE